MEDQSWKQHVDKHSYLTPHQHNGEHHCCEPVVNSNCVFVRVFRLVVHYVLDEGAQEDSKTRERNGLLCGKGEEGHAERDYNTSSTDSCHHTKGDDKGDNDYSYEL